MADPLTLATIAIYRVVAKELLPTPSKSHYLFNTRDLAKIIQGMMQATKTYYNSKDEVRRLIVCVWWWWGTSGRKGHDKCAKLKSLLLPSWGYKRPDTPLSPSRKQSAISC